jgi:SAM-dependent methyltransferase
MLPSLIADMHHCTMDSDRHALGDNDAPDEPWAMHAARWGRLGPPLRPCAEDLRRLKEAWMASLPGGMPRGRIEILSLGVTPEVALFPWAVERSLTAIDSSEEMIQTVWPGDGPDHKAVHGNWLQMSFADASFDLVVCDAGLVQLTGIGSLAVLGRELRRVLRRNGRAVMRHFARPGEPLSEDAIIAATERGQVHNFHELKLRLLLALETRTLTHGVRLGDVWDCFGRMFPDRASLARRLGCDLDTVATIDVYRGRDARYSFLPLCELALVFDGFHLAQGPAGHYPFAECCPVFSLTPRP